MANKEKRKIELVLTNHSDEYFLFLEKTGRKAFPHRYLYSINQLRGLNPKDVIIYMSSNIDYNKKGELIKYIKDYGFKTKEFSL